MNKEILSGKWDQIKGHVRGEWGDLTDKDIEKVKGSKDQLLGLLKEKYGYSLDMAENKLKDFMDRVSRELNIDTHQIMAKGQQYMHCAEEKMKDNVFQTALIAFGAGMIADRILRALFSSK